VCPEVNPLFSLPPEKVAQTIMNSPSRSCLWCAWAGLAWSGLLLITSCRERESVAPFPANVVAMVGTQAIPAETFQAELARRFRSSASGLAGPKEKEVLLQEMISQEVTYQRALAAGYDRDPQIAANLKRMIVAKFQEDQLAKLGPAQPTAGDIADYYAHHQAHFGTPERIRGALIELRVARSATPEKRAELAGQAAAIRAEALTNASPDHTFGLVAQRHSEHQASRYRGGDVGWLSAGVTNTEWPSAVREALFALAQPGDVSPVIETPTAFYLAKLVERQAAKVRPLDEVKEGVAYLVRQQEEHQRQQELQARLNQGFDIRINQALLESIASPQTNPKPPGWPGGPSSSP
jgi:parvulin-like peptidyl-prolyl isomerase